MRSVQYLPGVGRSLPTRGEFGCRCAHDLDEAADALGPERGLQKPPLAPPQLALAGGEPFPEYDFQAVMNGVRR